MKRSFFGLISLLLVLGSCDSEPHEKQRILVEEKNEEVIPEKDSIGLDEFWVENIIPILENDKERLEEVISFPLEGNWSMDMGFEKAESMVTSKEFFANYKKLFDQRCIEKLKELAYHDTQVYTGEGDVQLIVSNGWEIPYIDKNGGQNHREGGIILYFKRNEGKWNLFSIESMK